MCEARDRPLICKNFATFGPYCEDFFGAVLGSLTCLDGHGNENVKKAIG